MELLRTEYGSGGPGFALLQRASLLVKLNYDGNSMSMDVLDAVWFNPRGLVLCWHSPL